MAFHPETRHAQAVTPGGTGATLRPGVCLVGARIRVPSVGKPGHTPGNVKLLLPPRQSLPGNSQCIRMSVTAQVSGPDQATRRSAIRLLGLAVSVRRMFQRCFLAVERTERMTPNSTPPAWERKRPEIFCRVFIMLASRSASELVNGTLGSDRKRST